jgi:hypothetical protein
MKKIHEVIPFVILLIGAVVGVLITSITYRHYEVIANGILGLSIFYLVYQIYFSPTRKIDQNSNLLLKFPRDIKYFIINFVWSIILYLALTRVLDMLLWMINWQ